MSSVTQSQNSAGDSFPVMPPAKLLFCGVNYASHLEENPSAVLPDEPFFFSKLPSAVIGDGDPIVVPYEGCQVDYEVELAIVIDRRCRQVRPDEAMDFVYGFTLANDVSARDVQFRNAQITLGKNFDSFCPIGPTVVRSHEIGDPHKLRIRTEVNGVVLQDGSTSEMLFRIPELISRLSQVMTLERGDIVTTGTPSGVGCFRSPPVFLRPGDVVAVEADRIGRLENPVIQGW